MTLWLSRHPTSTNVLWAKVPQPKPLIPTDRGGIHSTEVPQALHPRTQPHQCGPGLILQQYPPGTRTPHPISHDLKGYSASGYKYLMTHCRVTPQGQAGHCTVGQEAKGLFLKTQSRRLQAVLAPQSPGKHLPQGGCVTAHGSQAAFQALGNRTGRAWLRVKSQPSREKLHTVH